MPAVVVIFLSLASGLYAKSIPTSTLPTTKNVSEPLDVDAEIAKIPCITRADIENLFENHVKYGMVVGMGNILAYHAVTIIGQQEFRKALGFSPPGPWTHYNETRPSEEELKNAATLEEYYEFKEEKDVSRSLDSEEFYERNLPPAIAVLDKSFPMYRSIFKRKLEEMVESFGGKIGRGELDQMLKEYREIQYKLTWNASSEIFPAGCSIRNYKGFV